ncbi:uncharacterized protein LOC129373550 [Poeciliopsis prolifica]|uniref:uncharacterized protein LOC129373550 n=1 Tax=Poeciliopsis prolifica TaxID=188132 RepID=UPI0024134C36|nr:uncharacterized protein LOC129373550 [Poeciliopsis prolifica]
MVSGGKQILGMALAFIGLLGTIIICGLPTWKVTAFIGANIVTSQVIWEGLWMNCVTQSTGQMQCKVYDSLLELPQDLQAARALIILAIIIAVVGILLGVAGGKCTNFIPDENQKTRVAVAAGVVFIVAGVLVLIPVCWTANTIIRDFYNPTLISAQKREDLLIMASMGMQLLASALCLLGWVGVFVSCVLPMWSVTAFVGSSIVTSQIIWEGIWMTCVVESTGIMQCKPYESQLALSTDRQAARALMILAIVTGSFGLLLAFVGGKCTRFLDGKGSGVKEKVAIAAGVVLMITGLLCLIPTVWAAGTVMKNFYSTAIDAQKRELGACLYIGWGAAFLLILGGGLFMKSSCPGKAHDTDKSPSVRYVVVRSSNGSSRAGSHLTRVPTALGQPTKPMSPWPQSFGAPTAYPQKGYDVESQQNMREDSERSWAPSTKSQMKRPESRKSEHSDAPSTKSQLKRAELDETLSAASENEDAAANPATTYL